MERVTHCPLKKILHTPFTVWKPQDGWRAFHPCKPVDLPSDMVNCDRIATSGSDAGPKVRRACSVQRLSLRWRRSRQMRPKGRPTVMVTRPTDRRVPADL